MYRRRSIRFLENLGPGDFCSSTRVAAVLGVIIFLLIQTDLGLGSFADFFLRAMNVLLISG